MRNPIALAIAVAMVLASGCARQQPTPLKLADEQFRQENWDAAIQLCDEALRAQPGDHEAYLLRGRVNLGMGDDTQAIVDFSAAIKNNPKHHEAYYYRALTYRRIGKQQQARADEVLASKLDPIYHGSYTSDDGVTSAPAELEEGETGPQRGGSPRRGARDGRHVADTTTPALDNTLFDPEPSESPSSTEQSSSTVSEGVARQLDRFRPGARRGDLMGKWLAGLQRPRTPRRGVPMPGRRTSKRAPWDPAEGLADERDTPGGAAPGKNAADDPDEGSDDGPQRQDGLADREATPRGITRPADPSRPDSARRFYNSNRRGMVEPWATRPRTTGIHSRPPRTVYSTPMAGSPNSSRVNSSYGSVYGTRTKPVFPGTTGHSLSKRRTAAPSARPPRYGYSIPKPNVRPTGIVRPTQP